LVVVVFECFVSSEMESDDDCDDFRVGHSAGAVSVFYGAGEFLAWVPQFVMKIICKNHTLHKKSL
jgi:hypothetical protein